MLTATSGATTSNGATRRAIIPTPIPASGNSAIPPATTTTADITSRVVMSGTMIITAASTLVTGLVREITTHLTLRSHPATRLGSAAQLHPTPHPRPLSRPRRPGEARQPSRVRYPRQARRRKFQSHLTQQLNIGVIVTHRDKRDSLGNKLAEHPHQLTPGVTVLPKGRLVKNHDPRFCNQHGRHCQSPLVPAGKRVGIGGRWGVKPQTLQ